MSNIETVIRPIVEGQLRSFISDHPDALNQRWIGSIAKRIIRDLVCQQTQVRLIGAFLADHSKNVSSNGSHETYHCDANPALAIYGERGPTIIYAMEAEQ